MTRFLKSDRNKADLYHVGTPLVMALVMAPSSLGGALMFLIVWAVVRAVFHG